MVPTVVAALFGSSLHTVAGPTNPVSLMVFAVLSPIAVPMTPHYIQLALTLALMSGIIMLALGLSPIRVPREFHVELGRGRLHRGARRVHFGSQLGNFLGIVSAPAGFTELVLERSGTLATPGRGWFSWRPPRSLSARSRTACCRGSRRC